MEGRERRKRTAEKHGCVEYGLGTIGGRREEEGQRRSGDTGRKSFPDWRDDTRWRPKASSSRAERL